MRPIAAIRKNIFKLPQHAFAAAIGVSQPTVSRWESGEFEPNRDDLERIREAAVAGGFAWDDRWFFEGPA